MNILTLQVQDYKHQKIKSIQNLITDQKLYSSQVMFGITTQKNITNLNDQNIRQLLLFGNLNDSIKKDQLALIIRQIEIGNKKLYKQFVNILLQIIQENYNIKPVKQMMFDHITQLAITANLSLVQDLNKDVFQPISKSYRQEDGFKEYFSLWKNMYNGDLQKEDFPNISKTLGNIITPQSTKLSPKLSKYFTEFCKNLQKIKEKKVEFFEDFDDSFVSESIVDQTRINEIIYMDIMELKAIRQRVQNQPISEQNCTEYLIKMKTFLNLKTNFLTGQLLAQFNKQKIWAKHFIDHHQEYLKFNPNLYSSPTKIKTQNSISLGEEQQSIDYPVNLNKNKNKTSSKNEKQSQNNIKNFTINEVPIDESRITETVSKDKLAVFQKYSQENLREVTPGKTNNLYQKMQLQPKQKRESAVKPLRLSKPIPQDNLPLEESILNNISIPVELVNPQLTLNMKNLQQFPKKSSNQQKFENSNNKNNFSASQNPFKNSKSNYNLPNDVYKNNKLSFDQNSPIQSRMVEDDLNSDNLDNIQIKAYYKKNIANSNTYNNDNQYTDTKYAKTQVNWNQYSLNKNLGYQSQNKIFSNQMSPRSQVIGESKAHKKRLSELTSEKKKRKVNLLSQQFLYSPDQYAYRPYSIHFKKNLQNFNIFRKKCLEDSFSIYANQYLLITCALKKIQNQKLQVQITYDNQSRDDLHVKVLYKIPKSFQIQKVSKINRNFRLKTIQRHIFNLKVCQFPLDMCFLNLSYSLPSNRQIQFNYDVPLPITIKNFIESLVSSRQEWTKNYKKLLQSSRQPYRIEKTFEINREIVQPSQLDCVLKNDFINIGASESYSVQQFGCICHFKLIENLTFLVRISVRIDHIATISVISEHFTSENERDFMKYYLEILVTLLGKYLI